MGKSLLTLDTLEPDRDFITIDDAPYYLRVNDEMSLSEVARIRRLSKRVLDVGTNIDSAELEIRELESCVDEILGIIMVAMPVEVIGKLTTTQKHQIISAFTAVASSRGAGAKTEKQSQPISEGSFQGSGDSTEAASETT